jgi:ankyrin repeat protein
MFERFTDSVTVVRVVQQGNLVRLRRLISGGCRIDRRTPYDPWMTPLDAAVIAESFSMAETLLENGAPIDGSSIYHAIARDAVQFLHLFQRHDERLFTHFTRESGNRQNPRLNRWLLLFTALDFATSIHAQSSIAFLEQMRAPRKQNTRNHWSNCTGIYIQEKPPLLSPAA